MENIRTKPHVFLVILDFRKDFFGCYGNSEELTPNIDKLAQDSIVKIFIPEVQEQLSLTDVFFLVSIQQGADSFIIYLKLVMILLHLLES